VQVEAGQDTVTMISDFIVANLQRKLRRGQAALPDLRIYLTGATSAESEAF